MKIFLVDLPAVDTVQDIYIKGYIYPTFTNRYLRPILEHYGISVKYYNLNEVLANEVLDAFACDPEVPIYIHLTANKYYSFCLFKSLVRNPIYVGGPMAKFCSSLFDDDIILIKDELEETGILRKFGINEITPYWQSEDFLPYTGSTVYSNQSLENDFSSIVLFGRGCAYRCSFCSHSSYHKKLHLRNSSSVHNEMKSYGEKSTSIYIADPSVGNSKQYDDIFDAVMDFSNLNFSMNIRADQVTTDMIMKLKKIRTERVYLGVESINDDLLEEYNKGENNDRIIQALKLLHANGIEYHLSFIIDKDFDIDKIMENKWFAMAKTFSFHFYIPYPGTYGFSSKDLWFENRHWPLEISDRHPRAKELKREVAQKLDYPINSYHTITPHDHNETFQRIEKKLLEWENLIQ